MVELRVHLPVPHSFSGRFSGSSFAAVSTRVCFGLSYRFLQINSDLHLIVDLFSIRISTSGS
jgi:hypothetical protein